MNKTTLYISGPMTGHDEMNFPAFHAIAANLRNKGFNVLNPAEIELPQYPLGFVPQTPEEKDEMWKAFMREDIKLVAQSDKVAVLPGWRDSKGANIEVNLAIDLGMEIINAITLEPVPQIMRD